MNKENFHQGISYDKKDNLGVDGLQDESAREQYTKSFEGLKDHPDWDGYLTLEEANDWYRNGDGKSLYVSLDKINLDNLFSLGEKYVDDKKACSLFLCSGSLNDALVYGTITLVRYPENSVRAYSDPYDFGMESFINPLNWVRNIATKIGNNVAGQGLEYEINIYNSKKLTPILS